MKTKLFTLLTLLLVSISSAWADATVGITTTTGAKNNTTTARTINQATNLTVTHQLVSTTSGALAEYGTADKDLFYGSNTKIYSCGGYKWNVNTGSTDILTANNYVGFSVAVASGYKYSLSNLTFQIAAGANFTYKLVITDGTNTLYNGAETTMTSYNSASATNYAQSINLSSNDDVQNLTGTFYVRAYFKFNGTGKYFCLPNFTITGTVTTATPSLTGAWKIGDDVVTEANVVQGASAPTIPTFTVGATSGTPTTDNYTVAYSLKDGSTAGIITFTDGVPTAISTATAGTATIVATLTTKDASAFLTPATNTFEYAVTVAAAAAPTINVTGSSSAARGADAITLTADVTGTPSPTIEWFKCDDALMTNPVSQGAASTANTTFEVATTTVGTYYFYAVANNGVGGDGDHNVFSDVKTISIVPKAPTITAAGKFTTSKTVTIAKADGEAVAATIKYKEGDGDWQDYSDALTLTATKTITAKVIQGGLESAEVSRTYTKIDLTEPTSISGAATWDWTTITNGSNIDFGDEGEGSLRNVDVLFCDISKFDYSAVTAPAAFNQTALIMNGQRPYANANSTKHCQVNSLKFTTTVAGKVSIEYANTGGNPARTVCVQVGSGDPQYGTHSSDGNVYSTNYVTDEFNVTAGTITIKGVLGSDHSEDKMLRIRKIVFTLPEPSTPTDDGAGHVTLTTTANMDGWRTYYPEKADQNYTADADVYYVSASNSTTVTLTKIDDGVPANTPVILHQTSGTTITLTETATDITAPGDNQLAVSTAGQNLGKVYRLGYKAANGVGFYTYTTTSAPAGIIYLATLGSANFLGLDFEDGETTGVASVGKPQTTTDREFYNLAGQRVAQPIKGLYIVNGKKVLVK